MLMLDTLFFSWCENLSYVSVMYNADETTLFFCDFMSL